MTERLLPTTVVGSYPQPDWLVDRALLDTFRAARARARAVAGEGALSGAGAGRRHACSRSATWSAPASTSSPTARCAAKATPTASPPRSTASTTTTPRPSPTAPAARSACRAWSARCGARARSRSTTWNSSAATHPRKAKITLPGPFTMAQQAKNEFYKDADEMVMDFAAAVNEEAHALAGRRRRRDPDRRSVAAQRSRCRQAHRGARARPRARRAEGHRPWCICASAMARWCRRRSRSAIRSCRNWPTARPTRFPSRRRSPSSISAFSRTSPVKTIVLGVIDLGDRAIETPTWSPTASARR